MLRAANVTGLIQEFFAINQKKWWTEIRRNGLAPFTPYWATSKRPSFGCGEQSNSETTITPGFGATKTGTNCAETSNFSASCAKSKAIGNTTPNSLDVFRRRVNECVSCVFIPDPGQTSKYSTYSVQRRWG